MKYDIKGWGSSQCTERERHLRCMKWKKQRAELYIPYAANCLKGGTMRI